MSALHPRGAGARALAGARTGDESFLAAVAERADLLPAHVAIAVEVVALAPPGTSPRTLGLLVLLVIDAVRRGSTHLPIAGKRARAALRSRATALEITDADLRALERVLDELVGTKADPGAQLGLLGDRTFPLAPLCGQPGDRTPLVVDANGIALARLESEERQLGALLSSRRGALASAEDVEAAVARIERTPLDDRGSKLDATQAKAVRAALSHPLTVVTGGPGTGKTSIVVAILRALVRLPSAPVAAAGIALSAPTGKAADRLRAAVDAALDRAGRASDDAALDAKLRAGLPEARTLHRLLGYHAGSDRFRHHEGNPLSERLVVVDEASMLDVGLFRRLVLALRDDAVLVLLGDRDQLPSVDAGAVLADLVRAADGGAGSVALARLETSHRMREDDPAGAHVLSVARRVRDGVLPPLASTPLTEAAITSSDGLTSLPGVSLALLDRPDALSRFADRWLDAELVRRGDAVERVLTLDETGFGLAPESMELVRSLLSRTQEARLLCVTRGAGLRTGADRINEYLSARYRRALASRGAWLPLEPFVVTRNDYERGLFNGDGGLVVAAAQAGAAPRLYFALERRGGVALHPEADVAHLVERGWALTVHRAQGSEHDTIALVLPDADVPGLLTRELVYTALTRARKSAVVVGSHTLLGVAAARPNERTTALRVT